MKFAQYLKIKIKKLIGFSLLSALISTAIFPTLQAQAATPRFNFLQGDYELLLGSNISKGETVWKDPVTGEAGDTFEGLIYYHNGIKDSVAENTMIRVTLPASTTNKVATVKASITSESANPKVATETIVDDNQVGQPNLTVILDQDAQVQFVPGSVKWFPNVSSQADLASSTPLPSGQSGNEIISGDGINIGAIQGCWEFAGFIKFQFRTIKQVTPTLTLNKSVRNLTAGESGFSKNTSAHKNEEVEFDVAAANTGAVAVDDIVVHDDLPAALAFTPGSLRHILNIDQNGITVEIETELSDDDATKLFNGGLPMGHPLQSGETHRFRFKTKVLLDVTLEQTVTNNVHLTAGAINLSSSAAVRLLPAAIQIERHKMARNLTTGQETSLGSVDGETVLTVSAKSGDEIVYTLSTKNIGGSVTAVAISDDISDILSQADFVEASNGGQVIASDNQKLVRYPEVTINPDETVERTFKVKIKNPLSSGDDKLVNVYGDKVVVKIVRAEEKKPNLRIEKLVRNVTASESDFVNDNEAFAGDTLEYKIQFSNSGDAPADQVKISDTLPSNTQYLEGTTVIVRGSAQEKTLPNGITAGGIVLDTISTSESGFIKFKVLTSKDIAAGEILKNIAHLKDDSTELSDSARTKIKAKAVAAVTTPTVETPKVQPPITLPILPKTGAAASASFLLTMLMGIVVTYFKYRRLFADQFEVVSIANGIWNS